jgi:UDP-N-acetylglucosamine--N-acetylmuramyl-(pentapeptide) pyrophosphoryl-undecaprenol N-acetylglucosamine transferase
LRLDGWRVVHQSGAADFEATRERYRNLGLPATVVPFAADMAGLLRGSHLAVSRAGGTTLAELAAAGVPAVLVPYPHAADDHQRINAEAFAAEGGCVVLDERIHPGKLDQALAEVLSRLLADPGAAAGMAASMRRMARPHAAAHVAALVEALLPESGGAGVSCSPAACGRVWAA